MASKIEIAFIRVKQDISSLRALASRSDLKSSAAQKELHDFIKAATSRMEKIEAEHQAKIKAIESSSAKKDEVETYDDSEILKQLKQLEKQLQTSETSVGKKLQNQEAKLAKQKPKELLEIKEELKQLRELTLDKPNYQSILKRIESLEHKTIDIGKNLKEADVRELKAELTGLTKDFSKLGTKFTTATELQKSSKKTDEKIDQLTDSTKNNTAELKQSLNELRGQISKLRDDLNELLKSEVDLDEYTTKNELSAEIKQLKKEIETIRKENEKMLAKRDDELRKRDEAIKGYLKSTNSQIAYLSQNVPDNVPEKTSASDGPGIANYISAFILLLIVLAAAYFLYTQFQSGQEISNRTNQPLANEPSSIRASEQTNNTAAKYETENERCIYEYECTQELDGNYNYNCQFDLNSSTCQCFRGGAENCSNETMAMLSAKRNQTSAQPTQPSGFLDKYKLHIIAFSSLVIFTLLLIYLFKKGEEAEREEK